MLRRILPGLGLLVLCAVLAAWFWLLLEPGDEMGYSILSMYLLMPLGALAAGCVSGAAPEGR